MKKRLKKISVTLLVMMLLLTSCRTNDPEITEQPQTESQTEEKTTEVTTAPDIETFPNPLTGEEGEKDLSGKRAVALVIKNDRAAAPQPGLSNADIVYEAAVEGGLTRFLALFSDIESLERIGPVIDSRYYFYTFASFHDAVFVQAGTTAYSRKKLSADGVKPVDALSGELEPAFKRDPILLQERGAENSIITDGDGVAYAMENNGIKIKSTEGYVSSLRFEKNNSSAAAGTPCSVVSVPYTNTHAPYFKYSTLYDEYTRYQYDEVHTDGDSGEPLRYKNVIVLFSDVSTADKSTGELQYDMTENGEGYYINSGKYIPIIWSRSEAGAVQLFPENSTNELILESGKTFICVCSNGIKSKVSIV